MKLHKETVSVLLWEVLEKLMRFNELKSFRLVGGTSLSLVLGHRMSADIDLFTAFEYADSDFNPICLNGKYWELIKLDIEEAVVNNFR